MSFKENVFHSFLALANKKIDLLQNTLNDLQQIGANETKSTAGDKHETALAMVQIEQAKSRNQLNDILAIKADLLKINPKIIAETICLGSLIKTNKGYFYLSVALGKITINDIEIISLSIQSPLGKKLLGLSIEHNTEVNGNQYIVKEIL